MRSHRFVPSRLLTALIAISLLSLTTGCAVAKETLDLSEQVAERAQWHFVAADAALGAFIEHLNAHPEIESLPVAFPDGSKATVNIPRAEAIAKLTEIKAQMAPLRDGLKRLNTAIQKGRTFAEFLDVLIATANPKDLVLKMLPGLIDTVTTTVPDETK